MKFTIPFQQISDLEALFLVAKLNFIKAMTFKAIIYKPPK